MRALLLAAALALPGAALAYDPTTDVAYAPGYAWFVAPDTPRGADGRIRVISVPGQGRAALTLNQLDTFKRTYRLHLGRLGMRMSLQAAQARALHAAWAAVVGDAPRLRVDELELKPLKAGALPLILSP